VVVVGLTAGTTTDSVGNIGSSSLLLQLLTFATATSTHEQFDVMEIDPLHTFQQIVFLAFFGGRAMQSD